jgi:CRISPR type IV-associated DEAD/DEAH-box helicase Csf4
LPDCDFLLIDEAHMLEETMANQVCGNLHLSMLRKSMRNGAMWTPLRMKKQSQIVLSLTEDAITILREIPNNETLRNSDRADEKWEQLTQLAPLLEALKAFHTKALENKDHKELKRVDDWYEILSKALSGKHTVRVTHSPVRSMPGITVGPTSVGRWLRELWSRVRGGAFYSGTLYTQKASNNEYSAAYAAYKLHVPPDRVLERLPIHPSWVYSLPTVFTPSKAMAGRLSYMRPDPKPSDREAVAAFIEYRQIENVGKTATGGTLVLCNSFEDIARFTKRLRTKMKRRLIVQVRDGASVPTIKAEFIAKAKAGQRPIWLGTGAAWTGLDLTNSTIAAAEDMILTDLIITRIPFGQNHTSTHLAKLERGFYPEVVEAGFKLRQGCGRLIRREGVVNRRIWFLDGRIHQGRHFMEAVRFFQRYTRRLEITG